MEISQLQWTHCRLKEETRSNMLTFLSDITMGFISLWNQLGKKKNCYLVSVKVPFFLKGRKRKEIERKNVDKRFRAAGVL